MNRYPFKVVFIVGERRTRVCYAKRRDTAERAAAKSMQEFNKNNPSSWNCVPMVGTEILERTERGWKRVD